MIQSSKPSSKPSSKSKIQDENLDKKIAGAVNKVSKMTSTETEEGNILRPNTFETYIGQSAIVRQLNLIIDSARIREVLPEHLLFYGQPGLGKTTLAGLIANELQAPFKVIAAPALQKVGDAVSLLVNIEPNTVLFIDEIHRLRSNVEEALYTAMEDKKVDLIMGKGQGVSTASIPLSPFVLVGATTQLGKISKPLKDRFPSIFNLQPYSDSEIIELLDQNCKILNLRLDKQSSQLIARRSRGVPRIANNILKRFLDWQTVHKTNQIDIQKAEEILNEIGIFELGLTKADHKYLNSLLDGSKALKTLSGVPMEEQETLEQVIEPYLIHLGFINKDSSGRGLTPRGRDFVDGGRKIL